MSVSSYAQNISGSFDYEDCGCGGVVDLQIHNGLRGQFGGDLVPDADEYSLGAITVANLNDTDGDGIVDNLDNDVTGTVKGEDEMDLMQLKIDITSDVAPVCDSIRLIVSTGLELWTSSVKKSLFNRTIAVNSLPAYPWVEAKKVSASVRDMSIVGGLLEEDGSLVKGDSIRITSVWVDVDSVYTSNSASPSPASLGINEPGLVFVIDNYYRAKDMTRYGFGPLQGRTFQNGSSSSIVEDSVLGGRILLTFDIKPTSILQNLSSFNIQLDITRRKNINVEKYNNFGSLVSNRVPWPSKVDLSNDDSNTLSSNDSFDEDTSPNSRGEIFSFDGPGQFRVGDNRVVIVREQKEFEEFVRISFKDDPVGNSQDGSRCSRKVMWHSQYDAAMTNSISQSDRYYAKYSNLEVINTAGIYNTIPRSFLSDNGNGAISITPLSTNNSFVDCYALSRSEKVDTVVTGTGFRIDTLVSWDLKIRVDSTSSFESIDTSTVSIAGPWSISNNNVQVSISNGSRPFGQNATYLFLVFRRVSALIPEIRKLN